MRIMIERALTQRIHIEDIQETLVMKSMLRITEMTTEGLKDEDDRHGQEVQILQSKLLVSEAQLS